jgi:hypothetical protein
MKTLLLTAAAFLAAGIVSLQAQVYSQNVVGYANIPTSGGTFLITVPFLIGASNGANEIWPAPGGVPTLPDFSTVLLWTGTKYVNYQSDSSSPTLWDMFDGVTPTNAPILAVGRGFFLIPGGPTTNVFAGTVAVNVGTSNKTHLAGGTFLVAPAVPYAGSVAVGNVTTGVGGACLYSPDGGVSGLPDFSTLLVWTGTRYVNYQSDSSSGTYWDMFDGVTPTNAPSISVGQGFFLIPGGAYDWVVGL